jgi:DNA-directed RNA polymerase subunit RPC12/RpoP
MSLLESTYQMSYRCWKCKEFFTLSVEDNQVKSIVKLTPEEYQKMKEVEDLRSKFRRQV